MEGREWNKITTDSYPDYIKNTYKSLPPKENTQMTNKHRKRCSALLVIKENQITALCSHGTTPSSEAKIRPTASRMQEDGSRRHTLVEHQLVPLSQCLCSDPVISCLGLGVWWTEKHDHKVLPSLCAHHLRWGLPSPPMERRSQHGICFDQWNWSCSVMSDSLQPHGL